MKELHRHIAKMIRLMSLLGLIGLMGCSDDPSPDGQRVKIEAMSCSTGFEEEGNGNVSGTRAWDPSPYYLYTDLNNKFAPQKDLTNKSIKAFFTQGPDKQEGTFYFRESESKWYLNTEIESSGTYGIYGFIPVEDAEGANLTPLNGNYSNGATLTINGLNTLTVSDVCVIIGAKEGTNENEVTGLTPGQFDVAFTSGDVATNHIYLLFDHIYSSLRFSFTLDPIYNSLRSIRLRKLGLIAYSDKDGGAVKAKYNATVTLKSNDNGESPIVGNITFVPDNQSADVGYTPLYEWDGTENTETDTDNEIILKNGAYTNFMGCFVPGVNTYFKLFTTYDVYDKNVTAEHPNGNLIRKGCQAENTIDLRGKFQIPETQNGHCYSYKITVQPTYLYVLSEPDVDNPTVVVN